MNFTAVAPNIEDAVVIPQGYQQAVVISWGDPVLPGAPAFDVTKQTAAAQRQQFGFNNDFAGLLPIDGTPNHYLLVVNHEYTTERFMFPGYDEKHPTREQFDTAVAAHGLTVVEVERTADGLKPVLGPYNRRLTADSPFTLVGPAAGSEFVKTAADPTGRAVSGTVNNCSGGVTPWGTVLSGEENFNSYFGSADGAQAPTPIDADRWKRYGIKIKPSERLWETFDPRFDPTKTPNEVNRFGYVVELNPWDPQSDAGQAQRDGPLQTRGRQRLRHPRRDRRGLQRRRRTLRLHVQVRLGQEDSARPRRGRDGAQHDDPRRGHAVRRQALHRHPGQPDRRLRHAAAPAAPSADRGPGSRCCARVRAGPRSRWSPA